MSLGGSNEMKNCFVLCLMEIWLNDNIPYSALTIDGPQLFRDDCDAHLGKKRGVGLRNKGWSRSRALRGSPLL